jgi:hypothetical protein
MKQQSERSKAKKAKDDEVKAEFVSNPNTDIYNTAAKYKISTSRVYQLRKEAVGDSCTQKHSSKVYSAKWDEYSSQHMGQEEIISKLRAEFGLEDNAVRQTIKKVLKTKGIEYQKRGKGGNVHKLDQGKVQLIIERIKNNESLDSLATEFKIGVKHLEHWKEVVDLVA